MATIENIEGYEQFIYELDELISTSDGPETTLYNLVRSVNYWMFDELLVSNPEADLITLAATIRCTFPPPASYRMAARHCHPLFTTATLHERLSEDDIDLIANYLSSFTEWALQVVDPLPVPRFPLVMRAARIPDCDVPLVAPEDIPESVRIPLPEIVDLDESTDYYFSGDEASTSSEEVIFSDEDEHVWHSDDFLDDDDDFVDFAPWAAQLAAST